MAKVARLLDQIVPERYKLGLDVDMDNFSFKVKEELDFALVERTRELVFHAEGLEISTAVVDGHTSSVKTRIDTKELTVTFEFEEGLPAGTHRLAVECSGTINESLHGFYRSRYKTKGKDKFIATTQLESVHAREVFVCIDEPAAKAVFELDLTVPAELTAISNTHATSEEAAGPGRKKVQFAPTPRMSSYILAFIVGELEAIEETTPEGVLVRVFATPGHLKQLKFALETGVRSLSFYNEYFGIAYPLSKLDMVAIPDFAAGAMENWGLVTYREAALLLDPHKTSLSNKQRVAEVITHELAHQWFGNLVTMAWWDDLWLNEGFASWMEGFAKDHLFPDWQTWTEFVSSDFAFSMELDGLANTHPIQVEVEDPRALDEVFDAVSYYKGSSVINMLHHYLGAEAFRKGLHNYLKKHSYSNATTHDLWAALAQASGKPVDEIMSTWVSQPGYPLVSFVDGEVQQRRFYSSPREAVKAQAGKQLKWPIPFSALTDSGKETDQELMTKIAMTVPAEIKAAKWFKPNPGQTGYYRTLYTHDLVGALNEPLRGAQIGPVDRFGIVNDVLATTEAGITDSMLALKLIESLRNETDYVVWGAVSGGFGSLLAVVEDEPIRQKLETFGHWLVNPNVKRLGWKPKRDEPIFDTLMRPLVLQQAVRFDDEAVTSEAKQLYESYMAGGDLDPDLRPAVLYAAARHGGEAEFDAMLERYRAETSPQVRLSMLGALGRFRKAPLIERYLELGLSADVRPQDTYIVIAYSFRNRDGRQKAWKWMQANWDVFVERYGAGGHMLERFPQYAADGFAAHEMAQEIKAFFEGHPHPTTKRPTAQAVEALELRADWYQRDKDKIVAFLDNWKA